MRIVEMVGNKEDEPFRDQALAIVIVMRENACGSHAAERLIVDRARAIGVPLDEVVSTIVSIGRLDITSSSTEPSG